MMVPESRLRAARILVVDDNQANVTLLADMLEAHGFRAVTGVTDPHKALALAAVEPFDLVLLDIRMPGMDGYEVMATLPKVAKGYVPVIMLTAQTDKETRMRALSNGARDFLTKPFDMAEVVHRIRNTLEAQLLYRERREQAQELENLVDERTAELTYLANHDPITGLPNRPSVRVALEARVLSGEGTIAVLAVERLDGVNEALGHAMGERVLHTLAVKLRASLGEDVLLGAWGGTEFVVATTGGYTPESLSMALTAVFDAPLICDQVELMLDGRVGACRFPQDGTDGDRLVQRAGMAAFFARQSGASWAVFTPSMEETTARRHVMERELRQAVSRDQLVLYYQPKVSLLDGRVIGAEALVRWNHPDMGFIPPVQFIPLAEETGAIVGIGAWVLRKACQDAAAWQTLCGDELSVAVNVSGRQFDSTDLAQTVREALRDSRLPPEALEVELTETALMRDVARARAVLHALRGLGIKIAIDDFGTGYSSLGYLRHLPIDTLKVDQSFVRDLLVDADDRAIIRTILVMADSLGLNVVAEGIETQGHVDYLRSQGCALGQGYFYAKPMPGADFETFLRRNLNRW